MILRLPRVIAALPLMLLSNATGQSDRVDVNTAEQRRNSHTTIPRGVLQRYPNPDTMLITRHEDGQSMLHARITDVSFALEGKLRFGPRVR
jgi:hypothetical protein